MNRPTIRVKVADAVLLAGLQAELLRPETIEYIIDQLTAALNALADQRPQARADLERAKAAAAQRVRNLIEAVEAGAGTTIVFQAIKDREAEMRALDSQLAALVEPLEHRLAVVPHGFVICTSARTTRGASASAAAFCVTSFRLMARLSAIRSTARRY